MRYVTICGTLLFLVGCGGGESALDKPPKAETFLDLKLALDQLKQEIKAGAVPSDTEELDRIAVQFHKAMKNDPEAAPQVQRIFDELANVTKSLTAAVRSRRNPEAMKKVEESIATLETAISEAEAKL